MEPAPPRSITGGWSLTRERVIMTEQEAWSVRLVVVMVRVRGEEGGSSADVW